MTSKMLKALLLTSALIAAGCDQQTDQAQSKGADILLRAQSYFDQGQYAAASIEARNALKENDKDIDAYLLLARIYHEQGNYAASVKLLLELPQTNPGVVELLGNNYFKQKKHKSLQQLIEQPSLQASLANSWALTRLRVITNIQQGDFTTAKTGVENLASLAKSPAEKADTEVVRSYLMGEMGQPAAQLQALDKALAILPTSVDALVEKARIRYASKDYEAAEDLLSQALIALPRTDNMTLQRMEVLQAMASTLSRQNRSGEAMIYSKLIAEANPKAQEIQNEFEQGIEKLKAGDLKNAEEVFSRLYLNNNARLAGSVLGLIRFQQGDYEKAMQFFEDTIDPETASPELLRAYAESQLRMRHPEQALTTIQANVNQHPDDPDLLGVYGLALLATGKTQEGMEQLKRALSIDPQRVRLKLALATAYNNENDRDQALQLMKDAFTADPADTVIQERLATQYAAMNKMEELKQFAGQLASLPAPQSKALGGLILLRLDNQRGNAILDKLYQESPSEPAVLRAQLRKNIMAKNYADVIRFGKQLVSIDPNDIGALGAVLQANSLLDTTADGLRYLNTQIEKSANAWGPEYVLAIHELRSRNFDRAREHASKAVNKSAYDATATALYAQVYQASAAFEAQAGNLAKAREVILEAMQNNEVTSQLMHLLIKVELADENVSEAEKLLKELEQTDPGAAVVYHARGDIAVSKKAADTARENYATAWKLQPNEILAADMWSQIRSDSKANQALFLADWTQKLPRSIKAHTLYGIHFQESGQASLAIAEYRKALALNPNLPIVLNNLAWLLMEQNQLAEAFTMSERAVSLTEPNASILDTHGWIAFKAGKKDVALKSLQKAAEIDPDSEDIKRHLQTVQASQ